ncbi:protein lplB [Paenibacillus ferrarius]|uniref:Protein lplB n=1 Tax=Paenibacillus ferrarius TaxID=1469647 RepID=A0A1V4HCY3_9BACL|nr:ABC transporter permease subunit [Paenibacillus ferrarius]OPH50583.1 protein lplB [Paenibacillus ferrarius]
MNVPTTASTATGSPKSSLLRSMYRHRRLYVLALPGIVYFLLFHYLPMWGVLIAFQDYSPFQGFVGSEWVGFKHFVDFVQGDNFIKLLGNTLMINLLKLVLFFPAPIVLALLLNEVRNALYKRFVQTIVYLPHFLSWVIVIGIYSLMFSSTGFVNELVVMFGGTAKKWMMMPELFQITIVLQNIWKETGWGTIIFLAALSSVSPELYEAAVMDGASRWRQLWNITLPSIRPTIIMLLLLQLGHILNTGFEQIFLMLNPLVLDVGDVFATYVYREGILQGDFSFASAAGLFNSLVGLILILGANKLTKKLGEEGLF